MKTFPRYIRISVAVAAFLLLAIASLNYVIDPLQHYRTAGYPPFLVQQSRFRLPGLARHNAAELIVAGTSVSKLQRPSDIRAIFGVSALTLAMDGASAHEQYLVLRLALRTGRVKHVIWDVNFEYLRGTPRWVSDFDGAFPSYLYDDSFLNDIPNYLLNLDTTKSTVKILAARSKVHRYPVVTPESFQEFPKEVKTGPEAIAKALNRRRNRNLGFAQLIPEFTDANLRESFRQNYLSLIQEYPGVTFDLYFPPCSEAYFRSIRDVAPEVLSPLINIRQTIHEILPQYRNVHLHDLQGDIALISDLNHYTDTVHFDRVYHIKILEAIKSRSHIATPERLQAFADFVQIN